MLLSQEEMKLFFDPKQLFIWWSSEMFDALSKALISDKLGPDEKEW